MQQVYKDSDKARDLKMAQIAIHIFDPMGKVCLFIDFICLHVWFRRRVGSIALKYIYYFV